VHWGCDLHAIASDGQPDFQRELLTILEDPGIWKLARLRAQDPELAQDAMQGAYCAIARLADPTAIVNLRAYFCRVLIREVHRLGGQLDALLVEDFPRLVDAHPDRASAGAPVSRPFDEEIGSNLLVHGYVKALAAQKRDLAVKVPGRSRDPNRYRSVIVATAEWVLRASLTYAVSDADCSENLRATYPEWFAEPGCAEDTYHQRTCRARFDIRALLQTIVNRDDL